MKARLVKPVKYDLSSRSSVFTPVSPISKTEILSSQILPDSGVLLDTGVRIRYIPTFYALVFLSKSESCASIVLAEIAGNIGGHEELRWERAGQ